MPSVPEDLRQLVIESVKRSSVRVVADEIKVSDPVVRRLMDYGHDGWTRQRTCDLVREWSQSSLPARRDWSANRDEDLRERVQAWVEDSSQRDVAWLIGIGHCTLRNFIRGARTRRATLKVIRAWAQSPRRKQMDGLRIALRRVLGRLPKEQAREIERQVWASIRQAFEKANLAPPSGL